jgi:hypothetical protein
MAVRSKINERRWIMTAKKRNRALRALENAALVGIAAAALLAGPAQAQMRGDCIRVELDAPVILPDGSTHEAGTLRLCLDRALNPGTGLHALQVNGVKAGMAMSRIGKGEAADERPCAVFERAADGKLRLIGYAVPAGQRMQTYTLRSFGNKNDKSLQANRQLLNEVTAREELIVLAAQRTR